MQSKSIWIGRQKIILLVTITLTGGFVGLAYVGLVYPSGPKKEGTIWLGLVIGLLVAFSIVTFELYFVAHPCSAIRRSSFVPAFLVRVGAQFVLIFVIIAVCRIVNDRLFGTHIFDLSPEGFVGHLQDISFSLVVSYAGHAVIAEWPLSSDRHVNTRVLEALREVVEVCNAEGRRIGAKTKELNRPLLISARLLERIELTDNMHAGPIGARDVKGSQRPIELVELRLR